MEQFRRPRRGLAVFPLQSLARLQTGAFFRKTGHHLSCNVKLLLRKAGSRSVSRRLLILTTVLFFIQLFSKGFAYCSGYHHFSGEKRLLYGVR
jgi:hypothetical protein